VKEQTEGRVSRGGDCEISDVEDLSFCVCMSKEGEAEEAGSVYLSSNDVCQNFPILCSNEDLSCCERSHCLTKTCVLLANICTISNVERLSYVLTNPAVT
jgi:hypothetical protein